MDQQDMTMAEFLQKHGITMHANPNFISDGGFDMDHWRCTLKLNYKEVDPEFPDDAPIQHKRQMTTYFSMGIGHHSKEPEAGDVLDCLGSDAAGYDNAGDFEEWASEYGYDTDSRKAERIYKTVGKQAARLKKFLGDDAYETLLWNVDRL